MVRSLTSQPASSSSRCCSIVRPLEVVGVKRLAERHRQEQQPARLRQLVDPAHRGHVGVGMLLLPYAASPTCSIVERHTTASNSSLVLQYSTASGPSVAGGARTGSGRGSSAVTSYPSAASESATVLSAAPTSRIFAPAPSAPSARKTYGISAIRSLTWLDLDGAVAMQREHRRVEPEPCLGREALAAKRVVQELCRLGVQLADVPDQPLARRLVEEQRDPLRLAQDVVERAAQSPLPPPPRSPRAPPAGRAQPGGVRAAPRA